jgi:hypothetical protein
MLPWTDLRHHGSSISTISMHNLFVSTSAKVTLSDSQCLHRMHQVTSTEWKHSTEHCPQPSCDLMYFHLPPAEMAKAVLR